MCDNKVGKKETEAYSHHKRAWLCCHSHSSTHGYCHPEQHNDKQHLHT